MALNLRIGLSNKALISCVVFLALLLGVTPLLEDRQPALRIYRVRSKI